MPKNKGAGGKKWKKIKNTINNENQKEMTYKSKFQEYAQITKSLGNGFMEILCFTSGGNIIKRAHIRGKMRKRTWLAPGDIVLVNVRDFQDCTCDIILKYNSSEIRILKSKQMIPNDINVSNNLVENNPFSFTDKENDESDSDIPDQTNKYDLPDISISEEIFYEKVT